MSEASSVFIAAPHRSHYHLNSAFCQHYGELYNYFIVYYNVIIIEIKCTINVMCLNHPNTISPPPWPRPWKNCLPWNRSLVPKRLGTAALNHGFPTLWGICSLVVSQNSLFFPVEVLYTSSFLLMLSTHSFALLVAALRPQSTKAVLRLEGIMAEVSSGLQHDTALCPESCKCLYY